MTGRLGFRILCIGSEPINLNLRCARLRQHGWDVASSGNSHDGIFALSRQQVDAVVLDLNHDGSESALIATEIRRQNPSIPIIMLMDDHTVLMPGAADLADAIVLKAQEEIKLHERLREFLLHV